MWRGLIILADYDAVTGTLITFERGAARRASATRPQGRRISRCGRLMPSPYATFSVVCPWQESNPWGSVLAPATPGPVAPMRVFITETLMN
jgi:hypothetical protein